VRTLAQITRQVAIVQYPVLTGASLRHIELIQLSPGRGLLIVVTSSGRVDQHPIDLGDADEAQVADLRGRLNVALLDSSTASAGARLDVLAEQLPQGLRDIADRVVPVLRALTSEPHTTRVVVGGVPNLTRFADQFETAVRPVLEALEEQVVLLKLLGDLSSAGDVVVRIGQENSYEPLRSTSVVASGYGVGADQRANLGVVGPTRMDYPSTMAAVRAVARYLSRYLEQG
jgi:heat-inducible transcriptional repressor